MQAYVESSFGTGDRYAAAAYSNEDFGAVRLLKLSGEEWRVVSSPSVNMVGQRVEIELSDLTGDEVPEVVVKLSTDPGVFIYWMFRFANGELTWLGPEPDESFAGGVPQPEFFDLDGDGDRDMIVSNPAEGMDAEHAVAVAYLLDRDAYRLGFESPYMGEFGRTGAKPVVERAAFSCEGGGRGMLLILNGHPRGTPVTSGEIRLNGQVVVGPSHFKQQLRLMAIPVSFQDTNDLSVEIGGKPGSWLTILARK